MATTNKLFALKGNFYSRLAGSTTAYEPFLNATGGQISMSIETVKQKSNGDEPGIIAEDEVSREATFELTIQSRHKENLRKMLYAVSVERPAATGTAFTLPVGAVGSVHKLASANVSNVTLTGLTEGVDFTVKAKSGVIVYLTERTATVEGTFDNGTYTEFGVFAASSIELEILFTSEKSGQSYVLYRVKLSPAQALQLVSDGNEFGSATLSGTLLAKEGAVADPTLGQYGRAYSVE